MLLYSYNDRGEDAGLSGFRFDRLNLNDTFFLSQELYRSE